MKKQKALKDELFKLVFDLSQKEVVSESEAEECSDMLDELECAGLLTKAEASALSDEIDNFVLLDKLKIGAI